MLDLQNLESIKEKYYFLYLNGIDTSNPIFIDYIFKSVYHSSKIYGCDFTQSEVTSFLQSGKTALGKDFFDYLVIQNIYDTMNWFFERFDSNFYLSLDTLISINSMLLKGIEYRVKSRGDLTARIRVFKGDIRKEPLNRINNNVRERELKYKELKTEMQKLLDDIHYAKNISITDVVDFYGRFFLLKPFDMGNGRTLRIAIIFLLFKAGYPLILFDENEKIFYEDAIAEYTNGRKEKLIEYFRNRLEAGLLLFDKAV